jgi:hypothetical protein
MRFQLRLVGTMAKGTLVAISVAVTMGCGAEDSGSAQGNARAGATQRGAGTSAPHEDAPVDQPGVIDTSVVPPSNSGAPACQVDSDCATGSFCDRGTVCIATSGARPWGNDCGVKNPGDGIHDPCGSYVCIENLCRSCVSDGECRIGENCIDIGEYGRWCEAPSTAEPEAPPPASAGTATP